MTDQIHSLLPPEKLTIHPALKKFPGPSQAARDALKLSIKAHGVLVPLLIDGSNQVYSGRARLQICEELDIAEVPVIRRDIDDVLGFARENAAFGRCRSLYIAALLIFQYHPDLIERVGKRGNPSLIRKPCELETTMTYASVAEATGVPEKYLREIGQIRKTAPEGIWEEFCNILFRGESSIGAAYAGAMGKRAVEAGRGPTQIFKDLGDGQLDFNEGLFPRSVTSLKTCFGFWDQKAALHSPMLQLWRDLIHDMPPAVLEETKQILRDLEKKGARK